jgi:hypothetical protein
LRHQSSLKRRGEKSHFIEHETHDVIQTWMNH